MRDETHVCTGCGRNMRCRCSACGIRVCRACDRTWFTRVLLCVACLEKQTEEALA